jgi:hypothetical protein
MGTLAMDPNAGRKVKTAGEFQDESFERHGSRCATVSGFSVHAGVSIRADDRKGLERLLRYAARPTRVRWPAVAATGRAIELWTENTVAKWD